MRIVILSAFTGYPDGIKRHFVKDERPDDLGDDYQELLVNKGLAKHIAAKRTKDAS